MWCGVVRCGVVWCAVANKKKSKSLTKDKKKRIERNKPEL